MGLPRLTLSEDRINDFWQYLVERNANEGRLLIATSALRLVGNYSYLRSPIPVCTFEHLLVIIDLLRFSHFSYGLSLSSVHPAALADRVRTKHVRALEFRG